MAKYNYEATRIGEGRILDLYRKDESGKCEEFFVDDGWKETHDAYKAFRGDIFTFSVSEELALDAIELWEENFRKNYGGKNEG